MKFEIDQYSLPGGQYPDRFDSSSLHPSTVKEMLFLWRVAKTAKT
jgi:hypothetical protein